MSIPKIVNLSSQVRPKSLHNPPSSKFPTGITFVFDTLHFRPEICQKSFSILIQLRRFCFVLCKKSVQSSAKPDARSSVDAYLTPVRCLVLDIFMSRISTISRKMYGETTSPCGTPCCSFILLLRCPFIMTLASRVLKKIFIHSLMSSPKPKSLRALVRKS